MNNQFNYKDAVIRTLTDNNEETWFAGVDVCAILDYQNPVDVLKKNLDDDEKKLTYLTDRSGQQRKTWIVNESGLYSLILSSSKPEAKEFKRWVTHEVLPSIRKAGKFSTEEAASHEAEMQKLAAELQRLKIRRQELRKEMAEIRNKIDDKTVLMLAMVQLDRNQLTLDFKKQE